MGIENIEVTKPKRRPGESFPKEKLRGSVNSGSDICAKVWLEKLGETYLAPGRVTLLERIDQYGSITKAAKSMEMSYRHAWLLVEDMNGKATSPLVLRSTGGRGGGGTKLTDEGRQAIEHFHNIQGKVRSFLETL